MRAGVPALLREGPHAVVSDKCSIARTLQTSELLSQRVFCETVEMWQFRIDKRQLTFYSRTMIASFKHKGLRNLFEHDDARRVKAEQVDRLRLILSALDQASDARDMDQPTFRLHALKGNRKE